MIKIQTGQEKFIYPLQTNRKMSDTDSSDERGQLGCMHYLSKEELEPGEMWVRDVSNAPFCVVVHDDKTLCVYSDRTQEEEQTGAYTYLVARFTDYKGVWHGFGQIGDDFVIVCLNDWLYLNIYDHITPFQTYVPEEINGVDFYDTVHGIRALAYTDNYYIVVDAMLRAPRARFGEIESGSVPYIVKRICTAPQSEVVYLFDDRAISGVNWNVAIVSTWDDPYGDPDAKHDEAKPWTETHFLRGTSKGIRTQLREEHD